MQPGTNFLTFVWGSWLSSKIFFSFERDKRTWIHKKSFRDFSDKKAQKLQRKRTKSVSNSVNAQQIEQKTPHKVWTKVQEKVKVSHLRSWAKNRKIFDIRSFSECICVCEVFVCLRVDSWLMFDLQNFEIGILKQFVSIFSHFLCKFYPFQAIEVSSLRGNIEILKIYSSKRWKNEQIWWHWKSWRKKMRVEFCTWTKTKQIFPVFLQFFPPFLLLIWVWVA